MSFMSQKLQRRWSALLCLSLEALFSLNHDTFFKQATSEASRITVFFSAENTDFYGLKMVVQWG